MFLKAVVLTNYTHKSQLRAYFLTSELLLPMCTICIRGLLLVGSVSKMQQTNQSAIVQIPQQIGIRLINKDGGGRSNV